MSRSDHRRHTRLFEPRAGSIRILSLQRSPERGSSQPRGQLPTYPCPRTGVIAAQAEAENANIRRPVGRGICLTGPAPRDRGENREQHGQGGPSSGFRLQVSRSLRSGYSSHAISIIVSEPPRYTNLQPSDLRARNMKPNQRKVLRSWGGCASIKISRSRTTKKAS
jgi:hypothetical protein